MKAQVRLGSVLQVLALLTAGAAAAPAADLPQLGKSPTKDVVAAMTREEKVSLVIGTGTRRPGASPDRQGPVVGETAKAVPGAAGTTVPISRLGIPAIVVADGPAGLRIQPRRDGDASRTYYCNVIDVRVSQRALREIYLRGFEIVVREARPWTVMSAG